MAIQKELFFFTYKTQDLLTQPNIYLRSPTFTYNFTYQFFLKKILLSFQKIYLQKIFTYKLKM